MKIIYREGVSDTFWELFILLCYVKIAYEVIC